MEARSGEEVWRDDLGHLRGGVTTRGGHDFDPKDYGEDKMWVVLSHQVVIDQVKWCCMCVKVTQRNPVLLVTLTHLSG